MCIHCRRLVAALSAAALAACAASPPAAPTPPPQAAAAPYQADVLRADLRALYEGLQETHYDLYARTPREAYDRLYREALSAIDRPMTRAEAEKLFQRFAAAGQIAHARIDHLLPAFRAYRAAEGRAFPLSVRIISDRVFIRENRSGVAALAPGGEITAINGVQIPVLLHRLRANVSADTDYMAASLIELDLAALLWLEFGPVEAFAITTRREDGPETTASAPAMTRTQLQAAQVPAALDIDVTERVARVLPGGVAYLRPGIFMNLDEGADPYDPAAFIAFVDRAFADFNAAGAQALLIDLRDNPGGHNAFSDPMIAWFADRPFRFYKEFRVRASAQAMAANAARLEAGEPGRIVSQQLAEAYAKATMPGEVISLDGPLTAPRAGRRFAGRVFVLVNRRSYSNAVAVSALVQDYRFGAVIGEPTSDLATTLGAMEQFALPNTGIRVGYPKAFIVRPNGDLSAAGVAPDIAIATPLVEGVDDPVLAEAQRIAAGAAGRVPLSRRP